MIKNNIQELDNLTISKTNLLPHFVFNRKSSWIKDEFSRSCSSCRVEFNFLIRKHHCRQCGKIYCHQCASDWIQILDYRGNDFLYIKDLPLDRVCSNCYKQHKTLIENKNFYFIFMMIPLDIKELSRMAMVSKTCNTIYKYYLMTIKNILHNQEYNKKYKIESNIIWNNRFLYSGHSDWILLLLKYIEQNCLTDKEKDDEFLKILYSQKSHNCNKLLCSSRCKDTISFSSAVLFLNNSSLNHPKCEKYILDRLWDAEICEYLCYFPVIVKNLTPEKKILIDYLISTSTHNYEIANSFFWELTFMINTSSDHDNKFYEELRVNLINKIQKETRDHLQNSYYFIENLKQFYNNPDFSLLLESYIKTSKLDRHIDISCPLNPMKLLVGLHVDNVIIKSSYLKPIIVPFIDRDNNIYRVMFKKDDLTRDMIVMNLIKLVDRILKKEAGLDLNITTYNILPIGNEFGLIEIVPDAETIYAINKKYKKSILNYILDNNSNCSIDEVRERFTKSCVSYCVLSYLLGIGDRHMENIMIRKTGEIFHIDFGFILGYDPKLLYPEIRLTNEMVDAMGGKTSKYYNMFKDLCTQSLLCLRKHIDLFKLMLGGLKDTQITTHKKLCQTYINNFIENKFLIGEDFNEVKLFLINKMDSRTHIYSDTLIDFCHNSITKESTNTLSNQAYNYGTSWVNYFYGKK